MTPLSQLHEPALPSQSLTNVPQQMGKRKIVPLSCLGKRKPGQDIGSSRLKKSKTAHQRDLLSSLPSGLVNGEISKYLEFSDLRNLAKAMSKKHSITHDLPNGLNPLNELLFHSEPQVASKAALLAIRAKHFAQAEKLLKHLKHCEKKFHDPSIAEMIQELSTLDVFPLALFQTIIHTYKRYAPEAGYPDIFTKSIEAAIKNCFDQGHFEGAQILLSEFPFRPTSLLDEKALAQLINKDRCDVRMADLLLTYFPMTTEQAGAQLTRIITIEHNQIASFIKILFHRYGNDNQFMSHVLSAISRGSWYAVHINFPVIIELLNAEQTQTLLNQLPPLCALIIVKLLVEKGKITMDGPTSRQIFFQLIRQGNVVFIQKLLSNPELREFFPNSFRIRAAIEAARNNYRSICAVLFRDGLILEPTTIVTLLNHLASHTLHDDEDGFCMEFLLQKLDDSQLVAYLESIQETVFDETVKSLKSISRIPLESASKILMKAVRYGPISSVKNILEIMKDKGILTFKNVKEAILEANQKGYWSMLEIILGYNEANEWPFPYGLSRNSFLGIDSVHSYFEEWWPKVYAVLNSLK